MPVYEFHCDKCGASFEARQTLAEHDNGWPECPRCHSAERVVQSMSSFTAVTTRKS